MQGKQALTIQEARSRNVEVSQPVILWVQQEPGHLGFESMSIIIWGALFRVVEAPAKFAVKTYSIA